MLVSAAAIVAAAFFSEPAFAQLPLGSSSSEQQAATVVQQVTQPVAQVAAPVAQTAAPAVQSVATPVSQAAAPVAQATSPVVQAVTAPAAQAAAPVAQQAAPVTRQVAATTEPVVQAAAPVLKAAAPVVEPATSPVLEATAPVLEAAGPLAETTASVRRATSPLLGTTTSTIEAVAPKVGSGAPLAATGTTPMTDVTATSVVPDGAIAQPTSAEKPSGVTAAPNLSLRLDRSVPARDRRLAPARPRNAEFVAGVDTTWAAQQATSGGHTARPAQGSPSRIPAPTEPSGLLGFLAAVSAAFGSSAALLFFAAIAAALFVAAPVLSRRLRLDIAPWPLPIALASLERPG